MAYALEMSKPENLQQKTVSKQKLSDQKRSSTSVTEEASTSSLAYALLKDMSSMIFQNTRHHYSGPSTSQNFDEPMK
jgi:hypothetical protein